MTARRTARKRQKTDTQDSQLGRAVRRANTHAQRVCNTLHTQDSLRNTSRRVWRRSCASAIRVDFSSASNSIEDTRKVSSQYIHGEEGGMLRDPRLILGRLVRFFGSLLNAKYGKLGSDIIARLLRRHVKHALGVEPTKNEITTALS